MWSRFHLRCTAATLVILGILGPSSAFLSTSVVTGKGLLSVRGICPIRRADRRIAAIMSNGASTEEREKSFEELLMRESAEMRSRRDKGEKEEEAAGNNGVGEQQRPEAVMLDDLVREGGKGGESTENLVKQLEDYGFGVVTVSG
jgi:hypothetical protein